MFERITCWLVYGWDDGMIVDWIRRCGAMSERWHAADSDSASWNVLFFFPQTSVKANRYKPSRKSNEHGAEWNET